MKVPSPGAKIVMARLEELCVKEVLKLPEDCDARSGSTWGLIGFQVTQGNTAQALVIFRGSLDLGGIPNHSVSVRLSGKQKCISEMTFARHGLGWTLDDL